MKRVYAQKELTFAENVTNMISDNLKDAVDADDLDLIYKAHSMRRQYLKASYELHHDQINMVYNQMLCGFIASDRRTHK
jgi:hypothetical protein